MSLKDHKFCIPNEDFYGLSTVGEFNDDAKTLIPYEFDGNLKGGPGYGWCCYTGDVIVPEGEKAEPIEKNFDTTRYSCGSIDKRYFCTDLIGTKEETVNGTTTKSFNDQYIPQTFTPINTTACYSQRSKDDFYEAEYQQHEGRLIKVNEHNEMALGTTPFYDFNSSCAWHLVGASPYGALKFMKIGLKKSIMKLPDNYNDTGTKFEIEEEPTIIRYYVANTYDEIL